MMIFRKLKFCMLLCLLCSVSQLVKGQYYDWGQEPASIKWSSVKTDDIWYIFPDYYEAQAARLKYYMDTIRRDVSYGFSHGPLRKMPLILHTQNYQSNGLVILAPKRMEYIVTPSPEMPAFPWLKQLAVHEYRHAVQYSNIDRKLIRFLSYIVGQQGLLVGLGLYPYWMLEGDAVMAETQMSTFGRGLQPSFSIVYRAMALENERMYPMDKYFCGSYLNHMPDNYQLGYQITSYAYTKYGENVWDKVGDYSSKYPFLIATTRIALKKNYNTTVNRLFNETFEDINTFWRSLPLEENTATIVPTPVRSYTTYTSPIALNDSVSIAVKSDLSEPSRIVSVNINTGAEKVLCHTGNISTGLVIDGQMLYWTEYRRSLFWEQRISSMLCSYDLNTGRKKVYSGHKTLTYPTIMEEGEIAGIIYHPEGYYSITAGEWSLDMPNAISLHGLAYDNSTRKLYFIALGDEGMWIGSTQKDAAEVEVVKQAGYTSMANLRAKDGRLYYNSIFSGKDEAHYYDIREGTEYQVTTSTYGSFAPSPSTDNHTVLLSTYTIDGYLLARQPLDSVSAQVEYAIVPHNWINPPRIKWDVMNLDSVVVEDVFDAPVRRYRKGLHLLNIHSWAPVDFDADEIINETKFDINAGLTLLSQNHLNSTFSQFSYGWDGYHHAKARVNYYGLAPKFSLDFHWSNHDQLIYRMPLKYNTIPDPSKIKSYVDVTAAVSLPFRLSSGYHYRSLVPQISYEFTNALLYNYSTEVYDKGLHKLQMSVQYSDNVRTAHRDFLPKWGYMLYASHTLNPFKDNFGKVWTGMVRGYLPGVAPHHSLMLRAAAQRQKTNMYNYRQKILFPRGADYDHTPARYVAASADYQLPVWYPEGGINSIMFIKRIRVNLLGDYAHYRTSLKNYYNIYTYGGDLIFDVSFLRMPENNTCTIRLSLYKPSDKKGLAGGFNFSIPI